MDPTLAAHLLAIPAGFLLGSYNFVFSQNVNPPPLQIARIDDDADLRQDLRHRSQHHRSYRWHRDLGIRLPGLYRRSSESQVVRHGGSVDCCISAYDCGGHGAYNQSSSGD